MEPGSRNHLFSTDSCGKDAVSHGAGALTPAGTDRDSVGGGPYLGGSKVRGGPYLGGA